MSEDMTEDQIDASDETSAEDDVLDVVKRKADLLGVKYGTRIGIDALRAKINLKMSEQDVPEEPDETAAPGPAMSKMAREAKMRSDMQLDAMRLIRVRIANLNPTKKDLHGEIFTVVNKFIGAVRKFVPYGEATDDGFHLPHVIYQQLKERKFLQIKTRTVAGQIQIEQRWVNEFALEVLEPLTTEERTKLAAAQAAAGGVGGAE